MTRYMITVVLIAVGMALGSVNLAGAWETVVPSSGSKVIDKAAKETSIDGEVGIQWRYENYSEEDPATGDDTANAGWAYTELEVETGSMWGAQLGVGGVFVQELWTEDLADDDIFDFGGTFGQFARDAFWTEAYLKYTIPNMKTYFMLGRADDKKFGEPASGDGDYYQGFGVTVGDIPRVKIRAHAVNEWANDASASWDYDGIQDTWAHMDDAGQFNGLVGENASDWAYTFIVNVEAVPDILEVEPYLQHQGDVGTAYGLELEAEYGINSVAVGMEGAWARLREDTPRDINNDDEDISQYIINPYVKLSMKDLGMNFKFGAGYYHISDDIPPFNTYAEGGDDFEDLFIWDEFDPMEEDIAKYGEQQNNDTYFVHAGFGWGPFDLEAVYGWCDDAVIENGWEYKGEGTELDIFLDIAITKAIKAQVVYCDIDDDFDGPTQPFGNVDDDKSFYHFSGLICYSF